MKLNEAFDSVQEQTLYTYITSINSLIENIENSIENKDKNKLTDSKDKVINKINDMVETFREFGGNSATAHRIPSIVGGLREVLKLLHVFGKKDVMEITHQTKEALKNLKNKIKNIKKEIGFLYKSRGHYDSDSLENLKKRQKRFTSESVEYVSDGYQSRSS